ncbi:hypothetical protein Tsubulata_014703 [Turnera subulata]|uniref:LOB domain-containing protein n=1 Tax=Turnera subulata TaxID=218843 RepID=A0A9Q0J9W6_9ROSI|nr:hypothetical protein Tsubulata_014703 [Turnera subulata]
MKKELSPNVTVSSTPTPTPTPTPTSSFTTSSSSTSKRPACAACKYQRKRCTRDCPLAPFFPAHCHKEFRNVHRLFGVKNVIGILNRVPHDKKADAMTSVVYEANARAVDPVRGCTHWIFLLELRVKHMEDELRRVRRDIAEYKTRRLEEEEEEEEDEEQREVVAEDVKVGIDDGWQDYVDQYICGGSGGNEHTSGGGGGLPLGLEGENNNHLDQMGVVVGSDPNEVFVK